MSSSIRGDDLTGLPTREALEALDDAFASRPDREIWSVMIADVDHFKLINDVYGHLHGDRILRQVADILARNVRKTDQVIRFGGDEFVVVMPSTGHMQAANQAQRILEDLEAETFPREVRVSLSLGVADSRSGERSLTPVTERADAALYQAKEGGRGRVSFYRELSDSTRSAEISFDHFVDRQQELRSLRSALDDVLVEGGRMALISGEPGIGKSRLVAELKHYCSFRGCGFLETKLDELGKAQDYSSLLLPVREHLGSLPREELAGIADEAGPFHSKTAGVMEELDLPVEKRASVDTEGGIRHRIFSDISALLRAIASERPLVFLIDDLQWISGHDLEMLGYLCRTSKASRIFYVATMRTPTDGYPEVDRQIRVLSRLVPFLSVELEQLPEEYASHMVMFALRDPLVPRRVLQKLVSRSGGNPLYLRELLKSLSEQGSISPDPTGGWSYLAAPELELPESISEVVSTRLDKLEESSRELLRAASLAIDSFTIGMMSEILGESELDVARWLREPLRMELVSEGLDSGRGEPLYRFRHDIVRGYLHAELTHGMRKALNGRFAAYFERRLETGETGLSNQVAHYYCDSLEAAKAAHYSMRAARAALEHQASRDGVRWLECYRRSAGSDDDPAAGDMLFADLELGRLYTELADHDNARRALEDASARACTDSDRGEVEASLGQLCYNMGDYDGAETHFTEATGLLPFGEQYLRSRMRLAFMMHLRGNSEEATRLFHQVGEELNRIEDSGLRKKLEADYSSGAGFVLAHSRSLEEGLLLCERATGLYHEMGDRRGEARARLNLSAVLSARGMWEERIRSLGAALEVLTELGDAHSMMVAYVNLGQVYFTLCQYEVARDYFEKCLSMVEATGTRRFEVWCRCYIAMIHERRGELERSRRDYETAIASARELGPARMLVVSRLNFALMLIREGEYGEALRLTEIVDNDPTTGQMGSSIVSAVKMTRALELIGNRDADRDRQRSLRSAQQLLEEACAALEETDSLNYSESAYYLAVCMEEQGRPEEARETIEKAFEALDRQLSTLKSSVYREDLLASRPFEQLVAMRERMSSATRE